MPLDESDWILLNAYLDGELAPEETAAFEARLGSDPAMQTELNLLQETVELIGMAQRRAIPRGVTFTLDPKIYGRAKPRRALGAWPVLGVAVSAAGALLATAMICGGALVTLSTLGSNSGSIAAVPAAEMEQYEAQAGASRNGEMLVEEEVVEESEEAEPMVEAASVDDEGADEVEAMPAEEADAASQEAPEESVAEGEAAEAMAVPAAAPTLGVEQDELPPEEGEPLDMPSGEGIGGGMGGGMDEPLPTTTPTPLPLPTPTQAETAEPWAAATPEATPSTHDTGSALDVLLGLGAVFGVGMMGLGGLILVVVVLVWVARRRR